MKRAFLAAFAASTLFAAPGLAAEPIEGTWLRPSTSTLVKFSACSQGYCGIVQNGEFQGKSIGYMAGSGKNYKGKVTDLSENKTYSGKASVSGNTMNLKGCVAGGLICKGEKWNRQ